MRQAFSENLFSKISLTWHDSCHDVQVIAEKKRKKTRKVLADFAGIF